MKCTLCKQEKDGRGFKGSHIIPEFLTRSMFNIGNNNKRTDSQLIISTASLDDVADPFIRGLSEEQIPKRFFKDLDLGENYNSVHPETVDYIFCNSCEKDLFGNLEDYFSSEVYRKIIETKAIRKNQNSRDFYEFQNLDLLKIERFIASIIWRCSVTRHFDFELNHEDEEKLRLFLLGTSCKFPFSYRLLVCDSLGFDRDNLEFINFISLQTPCLFAINNILIQLFFELDQTTKKSDLLLGTDQTFESPDFLNHSLRSNTILKIAILNDLEWQLFRKQSFDIYVSQTDNSISSFFVEMYLEKFGKQIIEREMHFYKAVCQRICYLKNMLSPDYKTIEQAGLLSTSFLSNHQTVAPAEMQTYILNLEIKDVQ
ncbi:hypothetical protein [Dyadobacter sp. 32]|uniref:hypothetical protein n=1 Tax=Dyadobacter sp. 32 TaxID=538966 RepID=UPI0011ED9F99